MVNASDAEVGTGEYVLARTRVGQPVEELSQAGLEVRPGSPAEVFQIALKERTRGGIQRGLTRERHAPNRATRQPREPEDAAKVTPDVLLSGPV